MAEEEETVVIGAKDVGILDVSTLFDKVPTTKAELLERENQVSRRCRGPLKEGAREKINELQAEGKHTEAEDLDAVSRKRCGYDMNLIFLAGELDGEVHSYECPKCGNKGEYRAAGPLLSAEVKG